MNAYVPFTDCRPRQTGLDKRRRMGEGLGGGPLQRTLTKGSRPDCAKSKWRSNLCMAERN